MYAVAMPDEPTPETGPTPRSIDARSLRALAHPLRMQILELLGSDGPATSTTLSARLGESTGTVSWHLRHLAEHGYIEEDTGRGTKRERWWRRAEGTWVLNTAEHREDPQSKAVLDTYLHETLQQQFRRVSDYLAQDLGETWRGTGTLSAWDNLRLTPDRLRALNAELLAVIERYSAVPGSDPEAGSLPVVVQLQSFPRKDTPAS